MKTTHQHSLALLIIPLLTLMAGGCGSSKEPQTIEVPRQQEEAPTTSQPEAVPTTGEMPTPPAPPEERVPLVLYESTRSLDASADAPNTPYPTFNIWVMKTDGTEAKALTRLSTEGSDSNHPRWSPDRTKILFISRRGTDPLNGTTNLWVMNADGSNPTPLTQQTVRGSGVNYAEWSPDGTKIVFESFQAIEGSEPVNPSRNIWVINADGTGARPLTSLTISGANNNDPQWSPDGTRIVFESTRALDGSNNSNCGTPCSGFPKFNIWIMNADGTGARPLTHISPISSAAALNPQWSPDGAKIAFNSRQALDGSDADNLAGNLWTVKPDGTELQPVTRLRTYGVGHQYPQWSPDGSKLACDAWRALDGSDAPGANNVINVWVVNVADGAATPLTRLTAPKADSYYAEWSPDGAKVFFSSQRDLNPETDAVLGNPSEGAWVSNIWAVNADGTGATPLTRLTAVGAESYDAQIAP